jgi:hypothetical protein
VPGGFTLAVAALALSAVAVAVSLVTRPPRTTVAAADRLALGLGIAMCLIPATRFGYVVYPMVLLGWFRLGPAGRWWPVDRVTEAHRTHPPTAKPQED